MEASGLISSEPDIVPVGPPQKETSFIGFLSVESPEPAQIVLDGEVLPGRTPLQRKILRAGSHRLVVRSRVGKVLRGVVEAFRPVVAGQDDLRQQFRQRLLLVGLEGGEHHLLEPAEGRHRLVEEPPSRLGQAQKLAASAAGQVFAGDQVELLARNLVEVAEAEVGVVHELSGLLEVAHLEGVGHLDGPGVLRDHVTGPLEVHRIELVLRLLEKLDALIEEMGTSLRAMEENRAAVALEAMEGTDEVSRRAGRLAGKGTTVVNGGPKVGRNDPCPCGSGKKYKRCCGAVWPGPSCSA